jgi:glucose-6-phosphate 1-dehydrogenase
MLRVMSIPSQVVIFGASGDLTRRKLIPALARVDADPRLPAGFSILGVSRSEMDDEAFRAHLARDLPPDLRDAFDRLAPRIFYQRADTSETKGIEVLTERLSRLPGGDAAGRLFYLSLKPELFPVVVPLLGAAGLLQAWDREQGFRRIVIEKPFGRDLITARDLNRALHLSLQEEQIYRIGTTWSSSRSPSRRRSVWRMGAAATTTAPERCGTCCRTTCCRCSR